MERPSPVPTPAGFVVKKGSKTREAILGAMPGPSSETSSAILPPGEQCVLRIDEQIQDDLLQLVRIRHRLRKAGFQAAFHDDVFNSQLIAAQRERALHN